MIKDVTDSVELAQQLARLLYNIPAKINLIPFNPFPGTQYARSTDVQIEKFKQILMRSGFITTVRRTRGDDIDAACGQLVGNFQDKTKRRERFYKKVGIMVESVSK